MSLIQFVESALALEPQHWKGYDVFDRSLQATYQVRCSGCGKFAKVISSDPGGGYPTYPDPSWTVECKRCGECEGYSGPI